MKKVIILFSILVILIVGKLIFDYNEKAKRLSLINLTGLNIPSEATNVHYVIKKIDSDNNYPYTLFAKIKISKHLYLEMVDSILINRLDTNNITYKKTYGNIFLNKNFFWAIDETDKKLLPTWWSVPDKFDFSLLYANVFNDSPILKIGDIRMFNGRIVAYYLEPFCLIYINSWPVNNSNSLKR